MEDSVILSRELAHEILRLARLGVDGLYAATHEAEDGFDQEAADDAYDSAFESWVSLREILFPNN